MLKLAKKIFNVWNEKKIRYCHWKSNEHLLAGLEGKTDLDILLDRKDSLKAQILLLQTGFRRFEAVGYLNYVSIEDFIGFDEDSGRLIHIHLHYELVIGRKFIKQYHLPWEEKILDTACFSEYGVKIIIPEIELALLVIRHITSNVFKSSTGNRQSIFTPDEKKEFKWLQSRVNKTELLNIAGDFINSDFAEYLHMLVASDGRHWEGALSREILKELNILGQSSHITVLLLFYYKKICMVWNYIALKLRHQPRPYKRKMFEGGRIIVFVGTDGSGKSTLIKHISQWFSWKIDVFHIYFGSGNGWGSFLMVPLKMATKIRKTIRGDVVNADRLKNEKKKRSLLFNVFKTVWAIFLAHDKKIKFKRLVTARNRGLIVLCDRYPQIQYLGFNDSPMLQRWSDSSNWIKRKVAEWEYNIYKQSDKIAPDIVIKLHVPAEVAVERKQDTPLYVIKEKMEIIENLKFASNVDIFKVNSSDYFDSTLLKIKTIIWNYL